MFLLAVALLVFTTSLTAQTQSRGLAVGTGTWVIAAVIPKYLSQ